MRAMVFLVFSTLISISEFKNFYHKNISYIYIQSKQ